MMTAALRKAAPEAQNETPISEFEQFYSLGYGVGFVHPWEFPRVYSEPAIHCRPMEVWIKELPWREIKPKPREEKPFLRLIPGGKAAPAEVRATRAEQRAHRRGEGRAAIAQGVEHVRHGLSMLADDPAPPDLNDLYRQFKSLTVAFQQAAEKSR